MIIPRWARRCTPQSDLAQLLSATASCWQTSQTRFDCDDAKTFDRASRELIKRPQPCRRDFTRRFSTRRSGRLRKILGGFRNFNLFEDLDFSRRMRCRGRVVTLRPPVISSARRFSLCRPWRTTWSDLSITRRYLRGVDPNRLAAKYYAGCQRAHRSAHLVTAASHNGSQ
jgi:hypothetical protein